MDIYTPILREMKELGRRQEDTDSAMNEDEVRVLLAKLQSILASWPRWFAPYSLPLLDDSTESIEDALLAELGRAKTHLRTAVSQAEKDLEALVAARKLVEDLQEKVKADQRVLDLGEKNLSSLNDRRRKLSEAIDGFRKRSKVLEAKADALEAAQARERDNVCYLKDEYLRPPADLVLLINPASEALIARDLRDAMMKGDSVAKSLRLEDDYLPPEIVSITSERDFATRLLFPAGIQLGRVVKLAARPHEAKVRPFTDMTVGHQPELLTHKATRIGNRDRAGGQNGTRFGVGGNGVDTYVLKRVEGSIQSPYWVVTVPQEILPNHNDIFVVPARSAERGANEDARGVRKPLLGILVGLVEQYALFEMKCP